MIIRERENDFVMIEQKNHAQFAGDVMAQWKKTLFQGEELSKSVDYAIRMHDYGWESLDKSPFWNDKNKLHIHYLIFQKHRKLSFILMVSMKLKKLMLMPHYFAADIILNSF